MIFSLVLLWLQGWASAHTVDGQVYDQSVLKAAVARFDRELDQARAGQWDLSVSPAYAELMAIRAGIENPMSQMDRAAPRMSIAPGTGASGQMNGAELPRHTWALTYDDGPHPSRTDAILDVLSRWRVKATFFWLAENVARHNRVLLRTEGEGHAVENHSYTHADLVKATDLALGFEISMSTALMQDHYQVDPRFFRCPYGSGANNSRVRGLIAKEKLVSVMWNVDSLDWADKNVNSVVERVRKQMVKAGRGIILFHDIQPHTASVTEKLFQVLDKSSSPIRFVTVPEIVDELND